MLDSTARTPEHVVYRSFVNETVLLNLEDGALLRREPERGDDARAAGRGRHGARGSRAAPEHYGRPYDEIQQDVLDFCTDLESRGLLELASQ